MILISFFVSHKNNCKFSKLSSASSFLVIKDSVPMLCLPHSASMSPPLSLSLLVHKGWKQMTAHVPSNVSVCAVLYKKSFSAEYSGIGFAYSQEFFFNMALIWHSLKNFSLIWHQSDKDVRANQECSFLPTSPLSAAEREESTVANVVVSCADLKTMSERLRNRYYVSKKLFMADLQRVFTNCKEYNPPESEYYKCASILEKFFFSKIKEAGLIDK